MHAATPEELAMKNVPFEPGAAAALLEWEHYQSDAKSYAREYVRIKIFTAEGLKYGNVEMRYDPTYQSIHNLEARTIHADGTVIPFKGQTFEKELLKTKRGRLSARTFGLSDVQPGSIIEYRYNVTWDPTYVPESSSWEVQRELPVVKERIWFLPRDYARSSSFRYTNVPKRLENKHGRFELELENVASYRHEPFAPPDDHLRGRIDFRYMGRSTKFEIDNYWDMEGGSLTRQVERAIASSKEALPDLGGAATDEEKLRKIYARVQTLELEHDEMNRTFVALARKAGFTAYIDRVSDRQDVLFSEAPDVKQLTSDIAVVMVGGKARYFDPGTKFTPFGMVLWNYAGAVALTLAPNTLHTLIETPVPSMSDALVHREADLHFDGSMIRGTLKVTWDGQSALVRRLEMKDNPEATAKLALEKEVRDWLPEGSHVTLTNAGPLKSTEPLVATLEVEMPNAASFTGSRAMIPMSVFTASSKNPFAAEQRVNVLDFQYPRTIRDDVTLQLTDGMSIESMPQNVTNDRRAFVYKTEWNAAERKVRFQRTFVINAIQLRTELYGQVREFWAKSLSADQEPLVLKRQQTADR
jgi:hypothetical protein